MGLILKSFVLSFAVFGRMIVPAIVIAFLLSIIWGLISAFTAGYADVLSGPVSAAFVSMFGIRVALSQLGDHRETAYDFLMLQALLYGTFLFFATSAAIVLTDSIAVMYADWKLGEAISIPTFKDAADALQFAFVFYAVSVKIVLFVIVYTAIHVVMAVPMASAARSAGHGAVSASFFHGFGRRFIPLFLIFAVSFALQIVFGVLTTLFAILPLILTVLSIIANQTLPDIDLAIALKGVFVSAGAFWLQSWVWSASAVALAEHDRMPQKPRVSQAAEPAVTTMDIRALRKSRERASRK